MDRDRELHPLDCAVGARVGAALKGPVTHTDALDAGEVLGYGDCE